MKSFVVVLSENFYLLKAANRALKLLTRIISIQIFVYRMFFV